MPPKADDDTNPQNESLPPRPGTLRICDALERILDRRNERRLPDEWGGKVPLEPGE